MRNRVCDQLRKMKRAEDRKARLEAKQQAKVYDNFARKQRGHKRIQFEFTAEQITQVTGHLRPTQARLLKLKPVGRSYRAYELRQR